MAQRSVRIGRMVLRGLHGIPAARLAEAVEREIQQQLDRPATVQARPEGKVGAGAPPSASAVGLAKTIAAQVMHAPGIKKS